MLHSKAIALNVLHLKTEPQLRILLMKQLCLKERYFVYETIVKLYRINGIAYMWNTVVNMF